MAANYVQPGDTLEFVAPAGGVVSGNAYLMGTGKVVVALGSAAAGQLFRGATTMVYRLPKAAALAIAAGDTLYWDNTAKVLNKTAAGNVVAGFAAKDAQTADTLVEIKLAP